MPRLTKEFKQQISTLSRPDLEDIVLKLAAKEKFVIDFIVVQYLEKEPGEKDLYDEAINDLEVLFRKSYKGFSEQLRKANMLAACKKRVDQFTQVSSNKEMEADLLMHILKLPFSMNEDMFGTCFTAYDTKVVMLLRRLINIVTKKLHEDLKMEYEEKINSWLEILHRRSYHIKGLKSLPQKI